LSKNRKPRRTAKSQVHRSTVLGDVQGRFSEALQHHRAGRIGDAVAQYERALALKPDHVDAHNNLGAALAALGRIDDAVKHYERAIAIKPDYAEAHNNLGATLAALGRIDDALKHYERAFAIKPDYAEPYNNAGLALAAKARIDDAVEYYKRAIAIKPDYADAHNNLGTLLSTQGRIDDAVAHYERAIAIKPDYAEAHNNLGAALARRGRIDDAVAHFERAVSLKPDYADAHNNLGTALAGKDDLDGAIRHCERAIAIDPNHAEAHNNLGNVFKCQGKFDDAMVHYARAIAIKPDYAEPHYNRVGIKTFHPGDAEIEALEALANSGALSPYQALQIHFAVAKALEDSGDYVRAFAHLHKGNHLKRRQINYDELATVKLFRRIVDTFDRGLFDRFQGDGDPSSVPIFVLGMPRSGSTLIEQILASHPQIHGAGELQDLEIATGAVLGFTGNPLPFPECVPTLDGAALRRIGQSYLARLPVLADGKVRIVDKLPANFLRIGMIRLVFPNARIIHTIRNPVDTCVSCYSKLFTAGQDFTYDLAELGRYYRCYVELMAYWRRALPPGSMLDVSYEELVNDLPSQARRMIDYCGLPWDDRCISFHKTNRPIKTASSVQARQPLFRSSLQRWRNYEACLGPLLHELRDILPSPAPTPGPPDSTMK